MKKLLLTCALGLLMSTSVDAAPTRGTNLNCAYSLLQSLVRDARDATQIKEYMSQGVNFDEIPRCGGSLMQLAVLRGNPYVLQALLEQDLKRAAQIVSLDEFPIPGAPKRISLWLFAAYYAPNQQILDLIKQAMLKIGANIAQPDDNGRGVLWYIEQNPVLRKTALYDALNKELLMSMGTSGQGLVGGLIPGGNLQQIPVLPNTVNQPIPSQGSLTIDNGNQNPPAQQLPNTIVDPSK